ICGDGTLQLIGLNRNGGESKRIRSEAFFEIDEDPVFDKPVPTADGWQLVSFEGRVFEVTVQDDSIQIGDSWSVLTEQDSTDSWRVGGGQLMDVHIGLDLLFMMMHQGEIDTHEEPGTEVWIFNRETQRRIARIEAGEPITNILVSQDENPILIATTEAGPVHIYDVKTTRKLRTIENPGTSPSLLQIF
ncbi:MAG: amine dehydrogenase large subunit, partial [Gammaproteobacteria bacterium]|nr:amine dehydrogenase large subunit [Gammaproteobacteria bacterium]